MKSEHSCHAGHYENNSVVIHFPFICFGGLGQPKCDYLEDCLNANGFEVTKKKKQRNKKKNGIQTLSISRTRNPKE